MVKAKKGFFFTLASLVLLVLVYSSIQYKISYLEEQSKIYKENIRLLSYELIFSQLGKEKIEDYLRVPFYYALMKLANHTALNPIRDNPRDEFLHLRLAFEELVERGESHPAHFRGDPLVYSPQEIDSNTIQGLRQKLSRNLEENGLVLNNFDVEIGELRLKDAFSVEVDGRVSLSISDIYGTSTLEFSERFLIEVPLEGMPDPLVNSYLFEEGFGGVRNIYPAVYRNAKVQKPQLKETSDLGQGWFYGVLVSFPPSQNDLLKAENKILVGTFEQISTYPERDKFGAYVITTIPPDGFDGYGKPFIVLDGFSLSSWRGNAVVNNKGEKTMFFREEEGEMRAYGIEMVRDSFICNYYFSTSKNVVFNEGNRGAPSFLQRMLENREQKSDPNNGIFSFLVSVEYGGFLNPTLSENSKLDFEFVKDLEGEILVGLPACKNPSMCSLPVSTTRIPRVVITSQNIDSLKLDPLEYPSGG